MKRLFLLLILLLVSLSAWAVQPNEMLSDPALEARARHIGEELRCLVCQNQSIDDSEADLAHDLRVLVRQRLQAGDSDDQVKQYLVARYGDYILLNPPFKDTTYALWLSPLLLLFLGTCMTWFFFRRRQAAEEEMPSDLSAEEQEKLKILLKRHESDEED